MTDVEQAFIDAFRRVDRVPIPPPAVQLSRLGSGVPSGPGGRGGFRAGPARLFTVAGLLAVVAGIIVGLALWQPWAGRAPVVVPVATPIPIRTPPVVLADTVWSVAEVDGDPVMAPDSGEVPRLEFDGGSQLFVGGPCGEVVVGYRQEGSGIRFTLPEERSGSCRQKALVAQQEKLWSALEQTREVERADQVLRLVAASGATLLVAHGYTYDPGPVETPSAARP